MSPDELKQTRLDLGLTQKEFSERIGYSERNYARIESGQIKCSKTLDLAIKYILQKAESPLD